MATTSPRLAPEQTVDRLANSPFVHLDGALHATFRTGDFAAALKLVDAVGEIAESMNHHPDISLGYGQVSFRLSSHDVGGVSERDLQLAESITSTAESQGAGVREARPSRYDLAVDCSDEQAIRDFWKTALDYTEEEQEDGSVELVDPRGRGPRVWFQHMEIPRTERNRLHVDIFVPSDQAMHRVEAVVGAGGRLVTDEFAPDWWVVADVEGNELCICTSDH